MTGAGVGDGCCVDGGGWIECTWWLSDQHSTIYSQCECRCCARMYEVCGWSCYEQIWELKPVIFLICFLMILDWLNHPVIMGLPLAYQRDAGGSAEPTFAYRPIHTPAHTQYITVLKRKQHTLFAPTPLWNNYSASFTTMFGATFSYRKRLGLDSAILSGLKCF